MWEPHTLCSRAVSSCHITVNLGHKRTCNIWKITPRRTYETSAALLQTLRVQLLRGCTGTHVKLYVIKQANYQLKHKFMFKILQVVIRTKQSIQYHLLVMVLAEYNSSYSLLSCRMMLATSFLTLLQLSNFFKTIVQLAHAPPMISCIHPVF